MKIHLAYQATAISMALMAKGESGESVMAYQWQWREISESSINKRRKSMAVSMKSENISVAALYHGAGWRLAVESGGIKSEKQRQRQRGSNGGRNENQRKCMKYRAANQ
jgi:hypothetical protein